MSLSWLENLILLNNGDPTYFSNSTGLPNFLDLALADPEMNKNISSCTVNGDIGSDHLPVVITLKSNVVNKILMAVNVKLWAQQVDGDFKNFEVTGKIENDVERLNKIFMDAKN